MGDWQGGEQSGVSSGSVAERMVDNVTPTGRGGRRRKGRSRASEGQRRAEFLSLSFYYFVREGNGGGGM